MKSILRTLTRSTHVDDVVSNDVDLSTWEVLSDSLSDDDVCSFYGDETMNIIHVISSDSETEKEEEKEDVAHIISSNSEEQKVVLVPPPVVFYDVPDDDDDDFYDDDDADDLEDELVPCNFKNRFGKQRVKKMGKTGGPKPKLGKSKKLPYHSNNTGYASRC